MTLRWSFLNCREFPCWSRADSRYVPSQWETSLQSNTVSHWLCANLESALPLYQLTAWEIKSEMLITGMKKFVMPTGFSWQETLFNVYNHGKAVSCLVNTGGNEQHLQQYQGSQHDNFSPSAKWLLHKKAKTTKFHITPMKYSWSLLSYI